MIQPLPVTIIGGYLGAGKTTLVNQMLRQADGQKLAILVNEFGELPIDEDLIEAQDDELISIAGGCICCSFGSDLNAAMLELAKLSPRPDHVVIEASGVALPGAIASSISLLSEFSVDGVCVLADCLTLLSQLADDYIGDTVSRQISDADLIVLSKADLVSDPQHSEVAAFLKQGWPNTRAIKAVQGRVPNAVLLGHLDPDMAEKSKSHPHLDFTSTILRFAEPVDAHALAEFLSHPQNGIVRAKGFVTDFSGQQALIQIVGPRAEVTFPNHAGSTGVVCIGQTTCFDPKVLEEWAGAAGED